MLQLPLLPPVPTPVALPSLPGVIFSGGKRVTPWFSATVAPCADRAGWYQVNDPDQLGYWTGTGWLDDGGPEIRIWRGLAYDPGVQL